MRISDWSSDVCSSDLNRRTIKGDCVMKLENLLIHCEDMVLIAMATAKDEFILRRLKKNAPDSLWLGATMPRGGSDRRHLAGLNDLAERVGSALHATKEALYATPETRPPPRVITRILRE